MLWIIQLTKTDLRSNKQIDIQDLEEIGLEVKELDLRDLFW